MLLLGERHLRRTVVEFVAHYHAERNHQGIGNELIQPVARTDGLGVVRRRQRMRRHVELLLPCGRVARLGRTGGRSSRTVRLAGVVGHYASGSTRELRQKTFDSGLQHARQWLIRVAADLPPRRRRDRTAPSCLRHRNAAIPPRLRANLNGWPRCCGTLCNDGSEPCHSGMPSEDRHFHV